MIDRCSFCEKKALYYTVSKENHMVARCKEHADTDVPKCSACDRDATTYMLDADTNKFRIYYCEDHA